LEPFVPIQVEKYTETEFDNQYEYYLDRNWIQNCAGREEELRKEILFYTARNPFEIAKFVGSR
jgi:small subunit ribosomal protein S29